MSGSLKLAAIACLAAGFALAAPVLAGAGEGQRYTSAIAPLLDAAGGKSIGSLQPGIAVDALGQSGTATHIAVHGWSAQGTNAVVFAAPMRRIVLVSGYNGSGQGGATQTVNGTVYQEVTVDGWVTTAALADNIQTVWSRASALYADKCGGCHELPDINSLSVNQWPAIMKTQAVNAGLDANESALLTAYLQVTTTR
jgi:trimethylamine-N-oxide reductase cytochrome c-type subunit TorC